MEPRSPCRFPKPISPATAAETVPLEEPKLVRSSFHGLSAELVFPPRELPQRHLRHEHRAGVLEPVDDGRVPVRHPVHEDARTPGRADAARVQEILHAVGKPVQDAAAVARSQLLVRALSGLEGVVARDGDHGGELAAVVVAWLAGQLEGRHVQLSARSR